jgi:hypothetical protein
MVRLSSILLGVVFFVLSSAASSITLSLSPVTQDIAFPGDVEVAIVANDLVNGAAPSLGVYDVALAFDPLLLAVSSVEFGDRTLGNQLDLFALGDVQFFVDSGTGSVQVFELSFDSVDDLNNLQAGDFTLAYVHFSTLKPGTSPLTLTVNSIGDADGNPLDVTSISSARVSITGATNVPEPGTLALLGLAMGLLAFTGRRARRA